MTLIGVFFLAAILKFGCASLPAFPARKKCRKTSSIFFQILKIKMQKNYNQAIACIPTLSEVNGR